MLMLLFLESIAAADFPPPKPLSPIFSGLEGPMLSFSNKLKIIV